MSLVPFWALNVVVVLLSMQGQKALGFHQKYLMFRRWTKVLQVWNDMRVSNSWQKFHFWVNYPFKQMLEGHYQTCGCSWGPLPPRCWFSDYIVPLNLGSWYHHCPPQHKACPPIQQLLRCSSCSACWQWQSRHYSKNKITTLVIYLTMENKHKTHPGDVFNMSESHLPEGRTFLPWLSVRSCHTHRPRTNCHLIEEIGETGSCLRFNFNCLRYRGSAFTFISTLALHIST